MKQRLILLLLVFAVSSSMEGWAQDHGHLEGSAQVMRGPFFPCTLTTDHIHAVVSHGGNLRERMESSGAALFESGKASATFDVTYTGFTPQARAAFQYAVDLWAASIESSVTIRIEAEFRKMGASVLGQAGPKNVWRDWSGVPESGVWYPDALADALQGADSNPGNADIDAEFNSDFSSYYFGLDGAPPDSLYDFVTVVLHELGHGLGFLGSASVNDGNGQGSWGRESFPFVYDRPVEDGDGISLLDEASYPNPSVQLGDLLQSNDLYANFPGVVAANNGMRAKLYAPASWQQASSYSHWDEATYPPDTTGFALMTPALSAGEVYHEVDAMTCGFFEDVGWVLGPGCGGDPLPPPPQEFAVELIGPNPARTSTAVRLVQPEIGPVQVELLDVLGRRVARLFDGEAPTRLPLPIDREGVSAGMYLLNVRTDSGQETLRITFL